MDNQFMMYLLLNNVCFILGLTAFGYLCYSVGKKAGSPQKARVKKKSRIFPQPLLDPVMPYSDEKIVIPSKK